MAGLEEDFLRFQSRGDSRALARVFDALAPELLLVAAHLSRDRARAEDLVQETFLQAISSVGTYDGVSPLRPWLVGILVRKAKMARRQEGREPDPQRLLPGGHVDPAQQAEATELSRALAETIASLSMPYRQVLNLHLVHGHAPVEIARILERSPDTVHTQLRRGMEMLRKALPTGFALPALVLGHGRGLAAVRQAVLEGARSAAVGGGIVAALGGVFAMKKLALVSGFAALAALVWWQSGDTPARMPPIDGHAMSAPPMTGALEERAPNVEEAPDRQRFEGATQSREGSADVAFLTGIVVTADGAPVADALVRLQQRDAQGFSFPDPGYEDEVREIDAMRSGEDGSFRFRVPRFRPFEIRVEGQGFAPAIAVNCRAGEEQRIELQLPGALEGQVTRRGDYSPVEGVRVHLFDDDRFELATTTDARGDFRFEDVPPGELSVSLYPVEDAYLISVPVDIEPALRRRLDLQVERGGVLRGTVVDGQTGMPIRNAEVRLGALKKPVLTDAHGEYVLRGFSGRGVFHVAVTAPGYGRTEREVPYEIEEETVMDFRLLPGTAVRGRVLDAAGEPEADVYVAAMANQRSGPALVRYDWQFARTGDDGRFLLTDLRPDLHHALIVRHPGRGMLVYDFPRKPAAGEVLNLGDVVLRPGATIDGTVVDSRGTGVVGVWLELHGGNRDRASFFEGRPEAGEPPDLDGSLTRRRTTRSGTDGRFSITDLSPGEYRIRAAFGESHPARDVTIDDWGEVRDGITLAVQRGLYIRGHVVTPEGETLGRGKVIARGEDADWSGLTWFRNGVFEIEDLEAGRYTLDVQLSDGADAWVSGRVRGVEAGTRDTLLVLQPVDFIEGIVRGAAGEPQPGISVAAWVQEAPHPRSRGPVLTDDDGRFRLKVGVNEVVNVIAGPSSADERLPVSLMWPDQSTRVTQRGVVAGTRDLEIWLR